LGDDRLVEIDNLLDLLPVQLTLKALFTPLNAGNELRHIVMLRDFPLRDFLAFEKVPAGEADLVEEIGRIVSNEVKGAFLLTDPRRKHGTLP
jgi:hypothetical protein